jgi:hypothetical protein
VNTTDDDAAIESVVLPGHDQLLGVPWTTCVPCAVDDVTLVLTQYTREIKIRNVAGENNQLRSVTVTITYLNLNGSALRTYTLTTFMSSYS